MKKTLLFFALATTTNWIVAQDLKGAFIRTNWVSANTYSFNITLLADAMVNIARPTLTLSFGDNTSATFSLSDTSTMGNTNIKTYTGTHTYPGAGTYLANLLTVYRVQGIKNMQISQMQSVSVGALINVSSSTAGNNAITILNPPVNLSVVNNTLIYNPSCSSPSGDSLSYSLDNCSGANYYTANGSSINPTTGQFSFSNDTSGTYAFLMTIKQWRKNSSNNQYFQLATYQMDFTVDVISTVGIHKQEMKNTYKLFPNPFTSKLNLDFSQATSSPEKIIIVNTVGQKVFEMNELLLKQEIDLSFLPTGVYYIFIHDEGSIKRPLKVVKN